MPILRRNRLRREFFATQAQNRGVELPSSTVLSACHGIAGITTTPLYLVDHGGPCIVWLRILVVPHTQRNATHPASWEDASLLLQSRAHKKATACASAPLSGALSAGRTSSMSLSTFDPNQAQNLPEIEKQIAVRCVEHAQTYWSLLQKVRGSALRLTKYVYFF